MTTADAGIYLDYAATTPMSDVVIEAMTQSMKEDYGNASTTYTIGRSSRQKIENVRRLIAGTLNADREDIIFTSGGTEANDSALLQTAHRLKDQGNQIITTAIEHSSVYKTMKQLASEGFEIITLSVDPEGHISLEELKEAMTPQTIMVSIMAGNNEVGSLQDLQAIGDLCDDADVFFHTDTVQTYMNVPIDVEKYHIDALSLSAHKLYGPKGIGFLYYRKAKQHFKPFIPGGDQENQHRAGTENVPAIVGMETAIEWFLENGETHTAKLLQLRQYFLTEAEKRGLEFEINGPADVELPHILNIYWPGHPSDQVLIQMDLHHIYLSAGSACTAGSLEPSRVLVDMYGSDSPRIKESLRVSFGEQTTETMLDRVLDVFEKIN